MKRETLSKKLLLLALAMLFGEGLALQPKGTPQKIKHIVLKGPTKKLLRRRIRNRRRPIKKITPAQTKTAQKKTLATQGKAQKGSRKKVPFSSTAISSVVSRVEDQKTHPTESNQENEQSSIPLHKGHQEQLRALRTTISKLVNEVDKNASIGVKVVLLKNNSTIYEKNAEHLFTPASNTKLITAAAAYHLLGPEYQFKTKLFTDKKIGARTINNLYIKGAGDPTLKDKDLTALVKHLKSLGIQEIKGNIIIDASLFAIENSLAPGWSTGNGPIFDFAPTGGLMVNHSCIRTQVKPARVVGKRPLVSIDPHTGYMPIQNNAKTQAAAKKHSLQVLQGPNSSLIVRGTIGKQSKAKCYRISVDQPHIYAGQVLAGIVKAQKITFRGTIKTGTVPENARFLVEHTSGDLTEIIRHMMKKSDNLYADALFKLMGAHATGEPGSWASGKLVIEEFLKTTVGLGTTTLKIFDGSGLSHKNKLSPNHFVQLLTWVYTQSPHKDSFIASLPIGGVDGSLRNRMKQTAPHTVKAKTGNLTGVTCLSGYITPKTGLPLIFVIMVNRKNQCAIAFKRKLEDQLCKILAAHAFSTS